MILVMDSSALIAYLRNEEGGTLVNDLIADANNIPLAHAVNLCEVFYDVCRMNGEEKALEAIQALFEAGVIWRDDMDIPFWEQSGRYKAELRRISLADCFCATLANRVDGEIVTADGEFLPVSERGICRVRFVR